MADTSKWDSGSGAYVSTIIIDPGEGGGGDDDLSQYVHVANDKVISANHIFAPLIARVPFTLATNAQGETVIGLKADQLNKGITAGAGLTGGGNLTGDVSLVVGEGTMIDVQADSVGLHPGTEEFQIPFTGKVPFTPAWATTSNNPTDVRVLRSDDAGKLQLAGLGIGVAQHATIPLYIHSATEQARFRYDVDNYFSITCGAGATTTLKTTGTGASGSMVFDPKGNLITSPDGKNILPDTTYDVNIGSPLKKYLTLYCAELNVETLVAQDVMATIGGRVLVAPTTFLTRDLAEGVYTLYVKHNNLAVNDVIRMEGYGNVEFMQITGGPTASTELLGNPGFETSGGGGDDVFASWTETKGAGTISKDGTTKHGGSFSCKFAANASGDSKVTQTITVTASTKYELNWWQYSAGYMGLYDVSNSQWILTYAYQLPNGNYTSWGFYQRFFTTPIGCTSIRVDFICYVNTISYWDDAHIGLAEYSHTVTRNLDGTGENTWYAGDALVNLGIAGDGWIDLYATSGIKAGTQVGPTIVGSIRNSTAFNDWNECWAIGNLQGLYDYTGVAYGAAFGKYAASNSWISVDSTSGVRIMRGTGTPEQLSQWDISGNILIGKSASDNVYITTAGALSIRYGSTKRIELTAAGILYVNDGGGNAVITLDASTGAEITKKLTMPGASSAISIGTTPPTSATVGTGIWIDRTGMYGLASNVLQAKFDAVTGTITAGADTILLDQYGIKILVPSSASPSWNKAYRFTLSGSNYGGMAAFYSGSDHYLYVGTLATDAISYVQIQSYANSGYAGQIYLRALSGTTAATFVIDATDSTTTAKLNCTLIFCDSAGANPDTNLYRSAANTLQTDDKFIVNRTISGAGGKDVISTLLTSYVSGESGPIFGLQASSVMGGAIGGVTESGGWTGALLFYSHANVADNTIGSGVVEGMRLDSSQVLWIGSGAGKDTNLYRGGANTLQTDDTLVVNKAGNDIAEMRVVDNFSGQVGGADVYTAILKIGSASYFCSVATYLHATMYGDNEHLGFFTPQAQNNNTQIPRIVIEPWTGYVTITNLAGSGNRAVYADSTGKLYC